MATWTYKFPINFNRNASADGEWGDIQYFTIPSGLNIQSARLTYTSYAFGSGVWVGVYMNQESAGGFGSANSSASPNLDLKHIKSGATVRLGLVATGSGQVNLVNIYIEITYSGGDPGTLTLDKTSMAAGETVKITLGKADSNIKRTVRVYFGSESTAMATVINNAGSAKQTINWTYPLAKCDKMPNKTSGTIKITMTPTEGSAVTKNMTIKVPADVLPRIGGFEVELDRNGAPEGFDGYIQHKSKCDYVISGAASMYGATIASQKVTVRSTTVDGGIGSVGPFLIPGEAVLTATVTDTRGRKATAERTIEVLAYAPPSPANASAVRCDENGDEDPNGSYALITSDITFDSLDGANEGALKYRIYRKGSAPGVWQAGTVPLSAIAPASVDYSQVIEIMAIDTMGESTMVMFELSTGAWLIHGITGEDGIIGAAINKAAEKVDCLEVNYGRIETRGGAIVRTLAINEVVLLMSDDNPADIWPGTVWVMLAQGRFPLSAGEDYEIGSTGGAENHHHVLGSAAFAQMYPAANSIEFRFSGSRYFTANRKVAPAMTASTSTAEMSSAVLLGGQTDSADYKPPWIAIAMWRRTA